MAAMCPALGTVNSRMCARKNLQHTHTHSKDISRYDSRLLHLHVETKTFFPTTDMSKVDCTVQCGKPQRVCVCVCVTLLFRHRANLCRPPFAFPNLPPSLPPSPWNSRCHVFNYTPLEREGGRGGGREKRMPQPQPTLHALLRAKRGGGGGKNSSLPPPGMNRAICLFAFTTAPFFSVETKCKKKNHEMPPPIAIIVIMGGVDNEMVHLEKIG